MTTPKSSVKIFCRVRPLEDPSDVNCVSIRRDERTIVLESLDDSPSSERNKEISYSFQRVFSDITTQKEIFDHVAYPLVQDLLQGKNGLIFTHGATSSGKSYTMTGSPEDEGLIPRSLDVIFNTIQDHQASKFVFKPNNQNGFEVQPIAEALVEHHKHLGIFSKTPTPKRHEYIGEWSDRVTDSYIVDGISSDKKYSIFISYVEIYNNYIYDLLEDVTEDQKWKNRRSKMLREDSMHNMYVFKAVENEVKTVKDALELFCKGQLHKKFSNIHLSNESTRSHCVFTIRVVQATIDRYDPEVLQNQDKIIVSQLSFVHLASCERSSGANTSSRKLKEAGSMNHTLKVLISCIGALMKSNVSGVSKMIPYQESKLSYLFKTFFEGKGEIRMIVCVNPNLELYNETSKFMKFAKTTSLPKSLSTPKVFPRKAGHFDVYREAIKKAKQQGVSITEIPAPDTYKDLLKMEISDESYLTLIESLEKRRIKRKSCKQDLEKLQEEFRKNVITIDKENIQLKQDNQLLGMDLKARVDQLHNLEQKLSSAEDVIECLGKELEKYRNQFKDSQMEIHNKNEIILNQEKDFEIFKTKLKEKLVAEKNNFKHKMEKKLAARMSKFESRLCLPVEKLRQMREILNAEDLDCLESPSPVPAPSSDNFTSLTDISDSHSRKGKSHPSSEKCSSETKAKSSKTRSCFSGFLPSKRRNSSLSNCQSIKSNLDSHFNQENEAHCSTKMSSSYIEMDNNSSSRTSVKKLSFATTDVQPNPKNIALCHPPPSSNPSLWNATLHYITGGSRGSVSNNLRPKRDSNSFASYIRHRMGKSKSDDVWLEHKPIENLELNGYIPHILKKRTVSSLNVKDLIKSDASHYVLQHQRLDADGELAVEVYKADIIPSSGGGAQVVFNDVVKMQQTVPHNHRLKRLDNESSIPLRETEKRCAISIQCHGLSNKKIKKK